MGGGGGVGGLLLTSLKRWRLSQIATGRTMWTEEGSLSISWDGAACWNCSTVNMQGGSESILGSGDVVWDIAGGC